MSRSDALSDSVFASLFADSCWIKFSKLLLHELTTDEAVLLCYLINVRQMHLNRIRNGWFYAKMKYIMRDLWFTKAKQTRVISKLKRKGFIKTKLQKTLPAKRLIKVDFTRLRDSISSAVCKMESYPSVYKSADTGVPKRKAYYTRIINLKESPSGNPTRSFEYECCQYFKDAIHSQTRRVTKWKVDKQTKHIRSLKKTFKDAESFLDVFEWYCNNLKNAKSLNLPVCYSPAELDKEKVWNWICDVWDKKGKREDDVPVGSLAKVIYKRLKGLGWPKGSEEQLPTQIQLSLDRYFDLKMRVDKYYRRLKPGRNSVEKAWFNYVLHVHRTLPMVDTFIENWFRHVNSDVQRWENWNGDLSKQSFTLEQGRFVANMRTDAVRYGMSARSFDKLLEGLNAKKR